jgi:hypothetical protein
MVRFHGEVGYGETLETAPGVWSDRITEVTYFGDVTRNTRNFDAADKLNSDISVDNSLSILADEYAIEHFFLIKYVRWAGVLWTVTNVEVKRPRLILSLGSVYNGPTPESSIAGYSAMAMSAKGTLA